MTLNIHFPKAVLFSLQKKLNYAPGSFARAGTNSNFLFPKHYLQLLPCWPVYLHLSQTTTTTITTKKLNKIKGVWLQPTKSAAYQNVSIFSWMGEWGRGGSLVQRFLFDPDGGAVVGRAVPKVPAQDVLAELGRVDAATARRPDVEALLEEAFEDLRTDETRQADICGLDLSLLCLHFRCIQTKHDSIGKEPSPSSGVGKLRPGVNLRPITLFNLTCPTW